MTLVERLRKEAKSISDRFGFRVEGIDAWAAADEIERLEKALETAREALEPFAEASENLDDDHGDGFPIWETPAAMGIDAKHLRSAAAAIRTLSQKKEG